MNVRVKLEAMNQELDSYNSRKTRLEDELAVSQVKREAVILHEQLAEAEAKRDKLAEEERRRGTPAQERERLLAQVKEDNAEISIMERHIAEAGDKLRQVQEEMGQLDMDLEDNMSERNQKYRELKKREETMDAFPGSFESNMEEELERLQSLGEQITRMLSTMSSNLETAGLLVFGSEAPRPATPPIPRPTATPDTDSVTLRRPQSAPRLPTSLSASSTRSTPPTTSCSTLRSTPTSPTGTFLSPTPHKTVKR